MHVVKLSSLLRLIRRETPLQTEPEDARYIDHIKAGTDLRKKTGRGDALALFAVSAIRNAREKLTGDPNTVRKNQAYVFHSLKHPAEIDALREIYGRAFFVISCYAPREKRLDALAKKIAKSKGESGAKHFEDAQKLIQLDEEEEGTDLGQNVGKSFPMADLFLDTKLRKDLRTSVRRFAEIIFNFPFHTPTKDELGMFHAKAAAFRSADLSRQVGAVIMTAEGEVVATGCNDVPKAGGGLYWDGESNDHRDFHKGYDSSAIVKKEIIDEVVKRFHGHGLLAPRAVEGGVQHFLEAMLTGEGRDVLKGTKIMNLLEFGRVVHAEMAAITEAARRSFSTKGTILYSTTFPCHMCARHIIAAGIERVVYIEPYPKSMAKDLYEDSLTVDSEHRISGVVRFEPFMGIAPRRYMEFFEMPTRKDEVGKAISWEKRTAIPRLKRAINSYIFMEQRATAFIEATMSEAGFAFS